MSDPRNIVMVSIDSLRADHCGFMDDSSALTPTLDRWADRGVAYENAVATGPRTPSSMPAVFTGRFGPVSPIDHWNYDTRQARISRHLARYGTMAERLQARGYSTVGITTNPWTSDFHYETSFARGFDRWTDLITANADIDLHQFQSRAMRVVDRLVQLTGLRKDLKWNLVKDWFLQWPQYYDYIHEELAHVTEPYFLWVFVLDTHKPYVAPPTYRVENTAPEMFYQLLWDARADPTDARFPAHVETRIRRAYRDAVRSVDGFLERLETDLVDDDPAYLVHSDHGEAFDEHGSFGHQPALYHENLHVPLILGNVDQRATIEEPVSLRAIPDLLTGLADGRALDPSRVTRAIVPSRTEDGVRHSVRSDRWTYIENSGDEELYDRRVDPSERTNCLADRPEVGTALSEGLAGERARHLEQDRISHSIEEISPLL